MNNDLISRKALLKILHPLNDEPEDMMSDEYFERDNMCSNDMLNEVLEIVEAFSSIDAKPVRHGWWTAYKIDGRYGLNETSENRCSICNRYSIFAYRFCPECGAKMDGGTNDGQNP